MTRINLTTMDIEAVRERSVDECNHISVIEELSKLNNRHFNLSMNDKINFLTNLWITIAKSPRNTKYLQEAFLSLYRMTLLTVLSPHWEAGNMGIRTHLFNKIGQCCHLMHSLIKNAVELYQRLQTVGHDPWLNTDFDWALLVQGQLDIEHSGVQRYLSNELDEIILGRIHFFVELKSHDYALSLARYFFSYLNKQRMELKKTRETSEASRQKLADVQRNFCAVLEWLICLLQRKRNIKEIIREALPLTCHDAIQLILALRKKRKRYLGRIAYELIRLFLVRDVAFPKDFCCTKDLFTLWCIAIQHESKATICSAVQELMGLAAARSAHFYSCSDVLFTRFGSSLFPTYVELYVRGLTVDYNRLDTAKNANDRAKVEELETHMAEIFHKLSTLFSDVNEIVERECILSSFSLRPTQQRLYILQSLTDSILSNGQLKGEWEFALNYSNESACTDRSCGINCSKACKDKKKPFHPLLTKGIQNVQYQLVKDLVIVLEAVRADAFRFSFFDWETALMELNEYLIRYTRRINCENSESEYYGWPNLEKTPEEYVSPTKRGISVCKLVVEACQSISGNVIDDSSLKLPNSSIPYIAANIEVRTENKFDESMHISKNSNNSNLNNENLNNYSVPQRSESHIPNNLQMLNEKYPEMSHLISNLPRKQNSVSDKTNVPLTAMDNPSTSLNSLKSEMNNSQTFQNLQKNEIISKHSLLQITEHKPNIQNNASKSTSRPELLPSQLSLYRNSFPSADKKYTSSPRNYSKCFFQDKAENEIMNNSFKKSVPLEGLGSPYRLISSTTKNTCVSPEKYKPDNDQSLSRKFVSNHRYHNATGVQTNDYITYTPNVTTQPKTSTPVHSLVQQPQKKQVIQIDKTTAIQQLRIPKDLQIISQNMQNSPEDLRIRNVLPISLNRSAPFQTESTLSIAKNSSQPVSLNSPQYVEKFDNATTPNANFKTSPNQVSLTRLENRSSVIQHTMQIQNSTASGFPVSLQQGQLKNINPFKLKLPQKLSSSKPYIPAHLVIQSQTAQEELTQENNQSSKAKHKRVIPGFIVVRKKVLKTSELPGICPLDANESIKVEFPDIKNEALKDSVMDNAFDQVYEPSLPRSHNSTFSSCFPSTSCKAFEEPIKNSSYSPADSIPSNSKSWIENSQYLKDDNQLSVKVSHESIDSQTLQSWSYAPENIPTKTTPVSLTASEKYSLLPSRQENKIRQQATHEPPNMPLSRNVRTSLSGFNTTESSDMSLQEAKMMVSQEIRSSAHESNLLLLQEQKGIKFDESNEINVQKSGVKPIQESNIVQSSTMTFLQEPNKMAFVQKTGITPLQGSSQMMHFQNTNKLSQTHIQKANKVMPFQKATRIPLIDTKDIKPPLSKLNKAPNVQTPLRTLLSSPVTSIQDSSIQNSVVASTSSGQKSPLFTTQAQTKLNIQEKISLAKRSLESSYSGIVRNKKMLIQNERGVTALDNRQLENSNILSSLIQNSLLSDFQSTLPPIRKTQLPSKPHSVESGENIQSHSWVNTSHDTNASEICCSPHEVQKCEKCSHSEPGPESSHNKTFLLRTVSSEKPTATVNPLKHNDVQQNQIKMVNSEIKDLFKKKFKKSPVQCTICNKLLASKYTLSNHMLKIHCDNPKRKGRASSNSSILTGNNTESQSTGIKLEKVDTSIKTNLSFDNQIQLEKLIDQYGSDIPFNDKMLDYFSDITDPSSLPKASDVESIEETLTCSKTDISGGQSTSLAVLSPVTSNQMEHSSLKPCNEFQPNEFTGHSVEEKNVDMQKITYCSPTDELQPSWQVTGTAMRYLNDPSYNDEQFYPDFQTPTNNASENEINPNSELNTTNSYGNPNHGSISLPISNDNSLFTKDISDGLNHFQMNKLAQTPQNLPFTHGPNWQHIEPKYFQFKCTLCVKTFPTEELLQGHITDMHATPIHIPEQPFYQYNSNNNIFSNELLNESNSQNQSVPILTTESKFCGISPLGLNENSTKSEVSNSNDNIFYSNFNEQITSPTSNSYVWSKSSENSNTSLKGMLDNNTNFSSLDPVESNGNQTYVCDICNMNFTSHQLKQNHMEKIHMLQSTNLQHNNYEPFKEQLALTPSLSNKEFIDLNEYSKSDKLKSFVGNLPGTSVVATLSSQDNAAVMSNNPISSYNVSTPITNRTTTVSNKSISYAQIDSPILASVLTSPTDSKKFKQEPMENSQNLSKSMNLKKKVISLEQDQTGKRNRKCDLCPKTLSSEASRKRHIRKVHKIGLTEESQEERLEKELHEKEVMNNVKAILEKSQKEREALLNSNSKLSKENTKKLLSPCNDKLLQVSKQTFIKMDTVVTEKSSNCLPTSVSTSALIKENSPQSLLHSVSKPLSVISIPLNSFSPKMSETGALNNLDLSEKVHIQLEKQVLDKVEQNYIQSSGNKSTNAISFLTPNTITSASDHSSENSKPICKSEFVQNNIEDKICKVSQNSISINTETESNNCKVPSNCVIGNNDSSKPTALISNEQKIIKSIDVVENKMNASEDNVAHKPNVAEANIVPDSRIEDKQFPVDKRKAAIRKFASRQTKSFNSTTLTSNYSHEVQNNQLKEKLPSIKQTVKYIKKSPPYLPDMSESLSNNKTHHPHIVTVPKNFVQRQIVLNNPSVKLVRLNPTFNNINFSKLKTNTVEVKTRNYQRNSKPVPKILSQLTKRPVAVINSKQSSKSSKLDANEVTNSCDISPQSSNLKSKCTPSQSEIVPSLNTNCSPRSESSLEINNCNLSEEKCEKSKTATDNVQNTVSEINNKENFLENTSIDENVEHTTISVKQVTADVNSGETKFTSDITQSILQEGTCPKIILKKVKSSSKKSKFKCYVPKKRKPKLSKLVPSNAEPLRTEALKPNILRQARSCVVKLNHLSLEKLGVVTKENKKSFPLKKKVPIKIVKRNIKSKTSYLRNRSEDVVVIKKEPIDMDEVAPESDSENNVLKRSPSIEEIKDEIEQTVEHKTRRDCALSNSTTKRRERRRSSRLKTVVKDKSYDEGSLPICITLD